MLAVHTASSHSTCESEYVLVEVGVGLYQCLYVPMLDVRGFHARPFRAREQGLDAPLWQA
jgi:hypothetical protein